MNSVEFYDLMWENNLYVESDTNFRVFAAERDTREAIEFLLDEGNPTMQNMFDQWVEYRAHGGEKPVRPNV